jgi:hypothetical protein
VDLSFRGGRDSSWRIGVVPANPATSVKGPRYVVKKGKTPALTAEEARILLDVI